MLTILLRYPKKVEWLWQWDQAVFRAVAHDARQPWLNPLMMLASALGLGHLQAYGLIAPLVTKKAFAWWAHGVGVCLGMLLGWASTGDLRMYNAVAGGLLYLLCIPIRREWRGPAILSVLLAGLFHMIIKFVVIERQRPSNFSWVEPLENVYSSPSFPSGHTTTSIAIGCTLYGLMRANPDCAKFAWIPLTLAVVISFSRVYVGVHWPTDVLAGAAIGAVVTGILAIIRDRRLANIPTA